MFIAMENIPDKIQNDFISKDWRQAILFILLIAMMSSLFFSRVVLSLSMAAFIVLSFFHKEIKNHFRIFFSTPLLWGMSLLFFLPLLSGLWSDDKNEWLEIIRIKLPLLFLPLSFASPFRLSKKQWEIISILFILLVIAGSAWSMVQYFSDMKAIHQGYLQSKILRTPLENDHVRFSWLVSVAILLSARMAWQKRAAIGTKKFFSWAFLITAAWLTIFLHILAVRTGLLCFYTMIIITSAWFIIKRISRRLGLALIIVWIAFPITAYFIFPTFQNRIKYFLYDLSFSGKAHYNPGMNDAIRIISMKAGWSVMNEDPLKGAGFGDILTQTKKWYAAHYPQMKEEDKIYPGSEWLMYGAGCGWLGLVIFTWVMFIPFFVRFSCGKLFWYLLNVTFVISFISDIGLEVQYGVFLYGFIVLWWWKKLLIQKP